MDLMNETIEKVVSEDIVTSEKLAEMKESNEKKSPNDLYVASMLAMTLGRAHGFVESLLIGSHALNENGQPLTRQTKDGTEFYVVEPPLLKEIVGLVVGGTAARDESGIPKTDEQGNIIKNPSLLGATLTRFLKNKE